MLSSLKLNRFAAAAFAGLVLATTAVTVPAAAESRTIVLTPRGQQAQAIRETMRIYNWSQGAVRNRAIVDQRGTGNGAGIGQRGSGNFGAIIQRGRSNSGTLTQNGNNNAMAIFQVGRGNTYSASQTGNGKTGVVIQVGR
jgi:Curlin associated repeat